MNAQEKWKELWHNSHAAYLEGRLGLAEDYLYDADRYVREAALERRIAALEREVANASEVIEGAYVTLGNGDFKNGVTDCSGSIDEGEVYAGRTFEEMRQWLLKHKTRLNYVSSEMSAP